MSIYHKKNISKFVSHLQVKIATFFSWWKNCGLCQSVIGWNLEISWKLLQNLIIEKNPRNLSLTHREKIVNFIILSWEKDYKIWQSFAGKNHRIFLSDIEKNVNFVNLCSKIKTQNFTIIHRGKNHKFCHLVKEKISRFCHFCKENKA